LCFFPLLADIVIFATMTCSQIAKTAILNITAQNVILSGNGRGLFGYTDLYVGYAGG